jgi:PKD repeat protein
MKRKDLMLKLVGAVMALALVWTLNPIPVQAMLANGLVVEPECAANQVGGNHTVTAVATLEGEPVPGIPVHFSVIRGPNVGVVGDNTTDVNGEASFTYTSDGDPGIDTIRVEIDDPDQPLKEFAKKVWLETAPEQIETGVFLQSAAYISFWHPLYGDYISGTFTGITVVEVDLGSLGDSDGNGLEEVSAEIIMMELTADQGGEAVLLRLYGPADGKIEELTNNTSGVLDIPPFAAGGTAVSTFEFHFSLFCLGLLGGNAEPVSLAAVIDHIPPQAGTWYSENNPVIHIGYDVSPGPYDMYWDWFVLGEYLPSPEVQLELLPESATNPTGTNHTVTAVYTLNGLPLGGKLIDIQVDSGPNDGEYWYGYTDAEGKATFTYTGDGGEGTDIIQAHTIITLNLGQDIHAVKVWETPNQPPVADVGGPYSGIVGSSITFDGSGSYDLDGAIISYEWDFDDGEIGIGANTTHAYTATGSYTVTLTVTDDEGATDTAQATVEIREIEIDVFSETVAQLLIQLAPSPGIVTPRPDLPPTDGAYCSPEEIYAEYPGPDLQIVLQETLHRPLAEPAPFIVDMGPDEYQRFESSLLTNVVVVTPGDGEPVQVELTGPVETIASGKAGNTVGSFEAEIISMELSGMTMVPELLSIQIRESPTFVSAGRIDITDIGGGLYRIESFFDVFTELSVDGGGNWIPSADHVRVELVELQLVPLVGPAETHVFFEGPTEGDAVDDDGDGLDEVRTEITNMDLRGITPTGPIQVGLRTDIPAEGEIEELANNTPGRLDLDPFHPGDASSFFDVWPEITMDGQVFFTAAPLRLETTIYHKPPQDGERYISPLLTWVELIDPITGIGTGNFVVCGIHQPDPTTEVYQFSQTGGLVELVGGPIGVVPTAFSLQGDAEVHVYFEGPVDGDAVDDEGTALDEVVQQLVSMNLAGGGVTLRVRDIAKSPFGPSLGQIEELANNTPGRLDLDPFYPGDANSLFDVLFEIELPDGTILHNEQPVRIQAVISEKPWNTCFHFIIPPESPVELYDEANQPTEVNLVQGCVFCPGGTITVDDVAVSEDVGAATFNVTLSNPSSFPVTVNFSTADGTATAGIDYTAVSGTLTFNPGDIFKTIPVLIVDDSVYEGDETFYVDLSNPANATIADGQGMGTIIDNDLSPDLMIEALIEDVVDAPDLPEATKTSLIASLDIAIKVLGDSNPKNDVAAFNVLRAFIKKVEAQCDKKIPEEVADALITKAQNIIVVLSLGP